MNVALRTILTCSLAALAACASGTSPGTSTSSASGATLQGTISGASSALQVAVPGTQATTTTDSGGGFVLLGVPAGASVLHLMGAGLDATVQVQPVLDQEHRTLALTVAGSAVTERHEQTESEFRGAITAIAAPALTVAGRTVTTTATTTYVKHGVALTFADLEVGDAVEVDGALQTDGSVLAAAIEVFDPAASGCAPDGGPGMADGGHHDGASEPQGPGGGPGGHDGHGDCDEHPAGVVFEGPLTAVAGTTLTVGAVTVTTSATTGIWQGAAKIALAALKVGDRLKVEGDLQTDQSVAAREIRLLQPEDTEGDVHVFGLIASLSAADTTFKIGDTGVATDAHTQWVGSLTGFADLKVGDRVGVEATRRADGTLLARLVGRMDLPPAGEFDARGAIQALGADGLTVDGKRFAVDAHTQVTRAGQAIAFADLKPGDPVEVHATPRTGGLAPLATRIEVEPPH